MAVQRETIGTYLQVLRERLERGVRDITFIQKTHLTVQELDSAEAQYAAMWGYKRSCARVLSVWSSGTARRAGVAILLNPYGAVKDLKGWGEEHWTEHLVMATGEIQGKRHLFINIYAPSHGATRTLFFSTLRGIRLPADLTIVCGGDFNCVTRAEVDRRGTNTTDDVGARVLRGFIQDNALVDTGECNMPAVTTEAEMTLYARTHHTHRHTAADGQKGSSRIDRWYISGRDRKQIRGVITDEGICDSDHKGVILEMHYPKGAVRIKNREAVYPPPMYVQAATRDMTTQRLKDWGSSMEQMTPHTMAQEWDKFKTEIKAEMKQLRQHARRRMTQGFRQKIRRIKRKLATGRGESAEEGRQQAELLTELKQLQAQRRAIRRRRLINKGAWTSKASTKFFFNRICTKYGDNIIPTLTAPEGAPKRGLHDKADTLADSWRSILNGHADNEAGADEFISKCKQAWEQVDLKEIDKQITQDEVAAAIKKCKIGKACGPDSIGNEWYRDYEDLLVPILTKLLNAFLIEGYTPKSFNEAYIFSISKGGDTSNGLNYRPIALLNTDYKIFTRILAWRVRKHIKRLVHTTQFGFIPGRTIHEAIDLLEAAKTAAKSSDELTRAQVLLLDFAKAYDSLDRDYLHKVLEAKGFPPNFRAIVKATHDQTSVRFMANGTLSRAIAVTSGIRQGCPLAPLLFILAVDLLYDAIQHDIEVQGVSLEEDQNGEKVQIAGYADDTAIYIADTRMQRAAIRTVQKFSDVSGLKLNLKKSVALRLGKASVSTKTTRGGEADTVEEVSKTRYLGHIAGPEDTTQSAWEGAFAALTTRLALAVEKTNTVQERAAIAAAIIMPKLMYVARHAWPTEELVQEAEWRIRNFVWKSSFSKPDKAPRGWIKAVVAELRPTEGGIGMPNFRTELVALAASTVGDWAMATNKRKQVAGTLLQRKAGVYLGYITPKKGGRGPRLRADLWTTGKLVVEKGFAPDDPDEAQDDQAGLRCEMRHRNGLKTSWGQMGLECEFDPQLLGKLAIRKKRREKKRGELIQHTVLELPYKQLIPRDSRGTKQTWAAYKKLTDGHDVQVIKDIMKISHISRGKVLVEPQTNGMPMESKQAHLFRELALSLLAQFPELVFKPADQNKLRVKHGLTDPHHRFWIDQSFQGTAQVRHGWAFSEQVIDTGDSIEEASANVAALLNTQKDAVWITPHPALTHMRPLWAGKRRWTRTRKEYKEVIRRNDKGKAVKEQEHTKSKAAKQNKVMGKAMETLTWKHVQRMHGVTGYQKQNIVRMKMWRLRLWRGTENQYKCPGARCTNATRHGQEHLLWGCPDARALWDKWLEAWGMAATAVDGADNKEVAQDIFSLSRSTVPQWLIDWGTKEKEDRWDAIYEVATTLWTMGCAAIITALWRWKVSEAYPDHNARRTVESEVRRMTTILQDTVLRYKAGLFPLTANSYAKLVVTEMIQSKWAGAQRGDRGSCGQDETVRLGFFDGGSRGNPGPGGSGSLIVEWTRRDESPRVAWAAATCLSSRTMTNNVAEFTGLQRLLAEAVARKWRGLQVVGDSAMILGLMQRRKEPKAKRLKPWYRNARKLADQGQVTVWKHHYRQHNKAADWLANYAMDSGKSVIYGASEAEHGHELRLKVEHWATGDFQEWQRGRNAEGKATGIR